MLIDHLGSSFVKKRKVSVHISCPFFIWVVCLSFNDLNELFLYPGQQPFVGCVLGRFSSALCLGCLFFPLLVFGHVKILNFDAVKGIFFPSLSVS